MAVESKYAEVVAGGARRGPYRRRSLETKRAIVRQCLAPGASIAAVALAHGVNANLVRKWIHKYHAGEYSEPEPGLRLLPVQVREAAPPAGASHSSAPPLKGHIDIELPAGRVRVHGRVDAQALHTVLTSLLR